MQQRILRVLTHIQRHLDAPVSLDELARLAHFSPFHFHRVFAGMVGETVMAYVRRLRLERAAYQLKYTDRALLDIAFDAGYETQESFTRAFKSAFDLPPGRFRKEQRPVPHAPAPAGVHFDPDGAVEGFSPLTQGVEKMEVRLEKKPPARALYLRHVGPYHEVAETWEQLAGWAAANGLFGPDAHFFGLCWDDPAITPPDKLRYDACVSVAAAAAAEPPFDVHELQGGDFAVALHEGPYARLSDTYHALFGRWLPQSGREPRGEPCREHYLNDPNVTEPEELLTEIWIPLQS